MTTYKTINGWTKEKMKETIRKYNNGTRAFEDTISACVYKTSTGNRCAVGCFLPEEVSEHVFNYRGGADTLLYNFPFLKRHMPLEEEGLQKLQFTHDNFASDTYKNLFEWIDNNVID